MCCTSEQDYRCAAPQSRIIDVLYLKAGWQMCCTSEQACCTSEQSHRCALPQSRLTDVLNLRAGSQICCTSSLQMCCTSKQAYRWAVPQSWPTVLYCIFALYLKAGLIDSRSLVEPRSVRSWTKWKVCFELLREQEEYIGMVYEVYLIFTPAKLDMKSRWYYCQPLARKSKDEFLYLLTFHSLISS
jgi:hypothetical protein